MPEVNPITGKPFQFQPRKRKRGKSPGGTQVIRPHVREIKPGSVKPPANLVAQVARHIAGDTSGFRTDWPPQLIATAASHMRASHYVGLENRGSAWVKRTIERIDKISKQSAKP